jgi:hypothetical protein
MVRREKRSVPPQDGLNAGEQFPTANVTRTVLQASADGFPGAVSLAAAQQVRRRRLVVQCLRNPVCIQTPPNETLPGALDHGRPVSAAAAHQGVQVSAGRTSVADGRRHCGHDLVQRRWRVRERRTQVEPLKSILKADPRDVGAREKR